MTKFSEVPAAGITIRESANDGSDFTNPAADYRRLFLGEDGQLHAKDSAGTVTALGGAGDITTDAAWAAKGDLIVGTGNNTAATLTAGADGLVLTADDGEATGLKWAAAGGGGVTAHPAVVQLNTGNGGLTLPLTPTSGNTLLLFGGLNGDSLITSITQTNVTWTKLQDYQRADNGISESVWIGAVSGSAGTVMSWADTGNSVYATVVEFVGSFAGTLVAAYNATFRNSNNTDRKAAGQGIEYVPSGAACKIILYLVVATGGITAWCYGGDSLAPVSTAIVTGAVASPGQPAYQFGASAVWDGGLVSVLEIN